MQLRMSADIPTCPAMSTSVTFILPAPVQRAVGRRDPRHVTMTPVSAQPAEREDPLDPQRIWTDCPRTSAASSWISTGRRWKMPVTRAAEEATAARPATVEISRRRRGRPSYREALDALAAPSEAA